MAKRDYSRLVVKVVGRGSETQLQVGEKLNYLIKRFNC